MEFKVGDKVKILDRVGDDDTYYPLYTDNMLQYVGTVTTIKGITNVGSLVLDNNAYYWDKKAIKLVSENKYLHPSELKDGDFIKIENSSYSYIYIFKKYKDNNIYRYVGINLESNELSINPNQKWSNFCYSDKITYATEEETKLLLNKLAEKGYAWNSFNNMLIKVPNDDLIRSELSKAYLDLSVTKLKSSQELNLFPAKKHYQLNFNY